LSISDIPRKKRVGGPAYHKAGCQCRGCGPRRRAAEALAKSGGVGGTALVPQSQQSKGKVINADLPPVVIRGNSLRDHISHWAAIRLAEPGTHTKDIARRLGLSPYTLYGYISQAHKQGWLQFDDPISRIDHEIIPKVLDNLSEFLDQKDKTITIETAKGTIFRQYQEEKGAGDAPQTVLALQIETAEPSQVKIITGHIVGKPKALLEGEEIVKD